MRLGVIPENPVERVVARMNIAPRPLLETQMAFTLARLVMEGVRAGVFRALEAGPASAAEVAERCGTHPEATGKLLFALAGSGYVKAADGDRYALTPVSEKWLAPQSKHSIADKLLLQFHEWDWLERSDEYLRTGQPIELHSMESGEDWRLYQRGMRAMANAFSAEAVRRMPVPKGATEMLDIGGSHGFYSAALCRRHEGLRSTVLDLPQAVEHARPLLEEEGMGSRVVHQVGNALEDDLGADAYDLVMIAQVVHHFSEEQNRELARRVARALRPGGVYAIVDAFRPKTAKDAGQTGALLEFYFALTSASGTWAPEEMADWQRSAGLRPRRPIKFRTAPSGGIAAAVKPKA